MLADAHRRAAEGIERALKKVWPSTDPDEGRLVIEGAWSASLHWIAYACQTKHGQHQEKLQQKQQQERQKQQERPKDKPSSKPPKDDKPPH